ncbi:MAG TPA: methyltransferase domain-containing protein [Ramlibacter sp.]|jgi:hypothetical protein
MRPDFQEWVQRLKEHREHRHRKPWEWAFICQALFERDMLRSGRKGLGFAVGQEPMTALFASSGANIVATDLFTDASAAKGWVETGQHASGYEAINLRGLCDEAVLRERVEFRFADMNHIPEDFHGQFDFVWSACAFEHLGSLELGKQFVVNSMKCLRAGGVAVHTTEFNVSSNWNTVKEGDTVLYRRRDIDDLLRRLRRQGHAADIDYDIGNSVADGTIDLPPYKHTVHMKLRIGDFVSTSIGLIISKGASLRRPAWRTWFAR